MSLDGSAVSSGCGGTTATTTGSSPGASSGSSPGGTPPPGAITRAEFVARANAICQAGNARQSALPSPGATVAQQLAYLDQIIAATADTLRQIRALPQPPTDRATLQEVYAKADGAVGMALQESSALRDGRTAAAAGLDAQLPGAVQAANAAFTSYGLTSCGSR